MIIAYNLCFSTCLGKPAHAAALERGGPLPKLGFVEYALPPGTLAGDLAPDKLVVTPNEVAFASKEARPGVLPRLLNEILNTRIMVGRRAGRSSAASVQAAKPARPLHGQALCMLVTLPSGP
jgi:DNA polymerase zeta